MKNTTNFNLVIALLAFSFTAKIHKANIQIISPKANTSFNAGQSISIEATISCERPLQSARLTIADAATGNVIFSEEPNVVGKRSTSLKTAWKLTQTDPSVLTLRIAVEDDDGHPTDKVMQFNANF